MKAYARIAALAAVSAFFAVSCGNRARVELSVAGAPASEIIVKQLETNTYKVLDTLETDARGCASYSLDVAKGEPEFVYLFYGDTKIASLLLEGGEKVEVEADTLGNWTVAGSEGSAALRDVELEFASFMSSLRKAADDGDAAAASKLYVSHYRSMLRRMMADPFSLTNIPVLYQRINAGSPVFAQNSDAVVFRSITDSLKKVYPQSRYVKALEKETQRRERELGVSLKMKDARVLNFPELNMPDVNGEKRALSSVDAKVIILHFWDASDVAQKMMNLDVLKPLYREYSSRGLEIYSVCLSPDKVVWGNVVRSQKLPWINVNDGNGLASVAPMLYKVSSLPCSVLIENGEISTASVSGEKALRERLSKVLK